MNAIRNNHFTILIKVNGRQHEFNFRERTSSLFDGDTSDERSNRFYFKILIEEGQWKLKGKDLPGWIVDNESAIINALRQEI